ncbi:hypothetical protein THRCLA_03000 [Thraustotheca clavata]|uniref:Uncharacterized protein n=1 Tax=Thraustotheca clavata TaxID=74557 RepID=A0A1W0A3L9_9STRA|nr:hypothetical protein THRCLA_03000 [Thraustotheca clavata]
MGDVVRIFGGKADPEERGPPKRVSHVVENIGEHVAASKKRASWKFTLGESDTVHEVVLFHSVVHFDGREQYMSNHMTPGDWSVILLLESTNSAMEVRINDIESGDIPKYDFLIDRVPYRRMDVYRRTKAKPTQHVFTPYPGNSQGQQPASIHNAGLQQSHWGHSGMTQEPVNQHPPPPPKEKTPPKPRPAPQPEVNLLDTTVPETSVPAHAIVFDPFVTGAPVVKPAQTNPSNDLMSLFAQPSATQNPPPLNPNAFGQVPPQTFTGPPMNRPPMMQQGYQAFPQSAPMMQQPPSNFGQPMFVPMQQQGYPRASPPPLQKEHSAFSFIQAPPAPAYSAVPGSNFKTPQANMNISSLLAPHQVNNAHVPGRQQNGQNGININAFDGMR